jgi:hypothetical protein
LGGSEDGRPVLVDVASNRAVPQPANNFENYEQKSEIYGKKV